jgi:hypothetical protein
MGSPYGQMGRSARPRSHHQAHPRRRIIIGAVLIVSIAAGGWYVLGRSPSAPSGEFAIANSRYLDAARAIPLAADSIHRLGDFDKFNLAAIAYEATMNTELIVFKRLESSEEGDAQQIATDAARAAALGINASKQFRAALGRTRPDDAVSARTQLSTAVNELVRDALRWNQL